MDVAGQLRDLARRDAGVPVPRKRALAEPAAAADPGVPAAAGADTRRTRADAGAGPRACPRLRAVLPRGRFPGSRGDLLRQGTPPRRRSFSRPVVHVRPVRGDPTGLLVGP